VQLTLDRINWKWGKRNINILMLAIVYRKHLANTSSPSDPISLNSVPT
jgi:hypothetical protein